VKHIVEVVQLSQTFKHFNGFIKDYVDNTQNPFCKSKVYCDISHECVYIIQGVSKRAVQLRKRIEIYTEDIHNVLNCQNVAKHTEFYLG